MKSTTVGPRKTRSKKFHLAIQEVVKNNLIIRVIINKGTIRDPRKKKGKASHVKYRVLDPIAWTVKSYDFDSGNCILVRGEVPGKFVDQFSVPQESAPSTGKVEITTSTYIRDPELRRDALDRAKGICEYCGKLGFNLPDKRIYLETHHVIPLGEGGKDVKTNIVAICPNDHREAHYGIEADVIRKSLLTKLNQLFPK